MVLKDILKNLNFFQCLRDDELEGLASHSKVSNFSKDEVLFYEDEVKQSFFYLLDGELKIYRIDRFDNEIFLYYLKCNSMVTDFIDTYDFTCKPCFATAVFTKKSKILSIECDFFVSILKKNISIYKHLIKESNKRIRNLENIINRDVVYDGRAKVAYMIDNDIIRFNTLKKHEIAYELHMQPETLSRILAKMVRNELIHIEKNKIKVLDIKSLRDIYT